MTRNSSTLSTYATTISATPSGDCATVRYHATDIVSFDPYVVLLSNDGYDTVTTRRKINQAATQFGLPIAVIRVKGNSYIVRRDELGRCDFDLSRARPFPADRYGVYVCDRVTGEFYGVRDLRRAA